MIVSRSLAILLFVSASLAFADTSFAVEKSEKKSSSSAKQDKRDQRVESAVKDAAEKSDADRKLKSKPKRSTEDREKIAFDFVKQHHSELVELLTQLKEVSPPEFDIAVRELAQSSDKLSRLKERDSQRYKIELKSWQARSRGELLAAQLQMDNTPAIREQLRSVLIEQSNLRVELLKLEEIRLSGRLEKVRQNIESMTKTREKNADKRIAKFTRGDSDAKKDSKDK